MPRRIIIKRALVESAYRNETHRLVLELRFRIEKGWIDPDTEVEAGILLKGLDRYAKACRPKTTREDDRDAA